MGSLKAKSNYNRICQLLINKGGEALRRVLHAKLFPDTLAAALNSHRHRRTLRGIRYSVIKNQQWNLLYPTAGLPDSKRFDITLLFILLRNICSLSPPATGWDAMPPKNDTSISADIARIKMYRNKVYGHIHETQYDDAKFEQLWEDISKTLRRLLILREDIANLKEAPLSPEEDTYLKKLKKMVDEDARVCDEVKDLKNEVVQLKVEVNKLTDKGGNSQLDQLTKFDFTEKIDSLCEKFQEDTRQWFFDEISRWFADEESRVMILNAGPGIGKSVLSAKVCQDYSKHGKLAGRHFCDFRKSNYSKPSNILESLASQMCDNVDGFREKLREVFGRNHSRDSLSDAFTVLLNQPLHALDRREPMLIVVDALDETKTDDKSEFLELISDEFPDLPKWIKILITSRPELQVKKKLEHFNPLEILPQDDNQQKDLKCFLKCSLPHFEVDSIDHLVFLCQGSFLYAYYMVKELKDVDAGVEPNLSDYAPRGISGFYERQFKRLRTGLQNHDSGFLNAFVNVVAASSGAPLPIEILLKCLNLSDEKYEIRSTIINVMSEILPVYDNCLTVYHKSLTDWLTLEGYEEHAFVADVDDGTKRLWEVCEAIYRDIDSLKSVSDFELSSERKFALENGGEYLVNVGDTVDFHWLANIRLNALKFRLCGGLNVDYCRMLNNYKSALSEDLYWSLVRHYCISNMIATCDVGLHANSKIIMHCMYLQSLANTHFDLAQRYSGYQNTASDILNETNQIWLEEVVNVRDSDYEVISNAVFPKDVFSGRSSCFVSSPDKKLLVCVHGKMAKVFQLPSLTMIFELKLSRASDYLQALTFSPDSSYFLYNSLRSCVCIAKQKEMKFISGGPEFVDSCSFSSCGMKLVTSENMFVKVWDVEKRDLLEQLQAPSPIERCLFSTRNAYILGLEKHSSVGFCIWHATTWQKLDFKICVDSCLTCKGSFQIITRPSNINDHDTCPFYHFHLPTDEIVVVTAGGLCKDSFTWKSRKCVFIPISSYGLLMFDVIKQKVIDRFKIDCLPCDSRIHCIAQLNEANFAFCYRLCHVFVLSLRTPEESSVGSHVNSALKCVTVSPDQFYVACCYKNCVLTIRNIDNGETMQTVELQHPPEACWWSELYLWVVCKGVIVKFRYDSGHPKGLGSCINECTLKFHRILQFEKDVLVIEAEEGIIMVKICENELIPQEIHNSIFFASYAAISPDGCAVLLYNYRSEYQLWEFARENRWELQYLYGRFPNRNTVQVHWLSLTGTRNSRRCMYLTYDNNGSPKFDLSFNSIDVSNRHISPSWDKCVLNSVGYFIRQVYYVAPNFLLIYWSRWVHVYNVLDGKIITVLYFGNVCETLRNAPSFYLSSRGLLLFILRNDVKCFRINNIENCLES